MKKCAFLFDFDGVIADSEPLHLETFREILAPLGIKISEERWYREFVGIGSPRIMKILLGEVGIEDEDVIKSYVEKRRDLFQKRITENKLQAKNGVKKFLEETKRFGIKTAVVSGSHKNNISLALNILKLERYFDIIIGREDYAKNKPDPECYLVAAEKLGMKREECLAFEDSIAGCLAAQNAGMKVIAIEAPENVEKYDCKPIMKIRDFEKLRVEKILEML